MLITRAFSLTPTTSNTQFNMMMAVVAIQAGLLLPMPSTMAPNNGVRAADPE